MRVHPDIRAQCVQGQNQIMKFNNKSKQNSDNEDYQPEHSPGAQGGDIEDTPRQSRMSKRLLSKNSLRDEPQTPETSNSTVPKNTGTIKKARISKTPPDTVSDEDARSTCSNRSKTGKSKTLPHRETKSKIKTIQTECSNLKDVEKLCERLSASNKQAIIGYIESILNSNIQLAEQLSKFQADLIKQEEVNIRLSKRLDALENKHPPKPAAKTEKPTYTKVASKQNKLNSIKDLVKLIPTLKPNSPQNVAKIVPPKGTNNPGKEILNIYNPVEFNIKVRSLRQTANKDLIVRTDGPEDIKKLTAAGDLTKHGYKVIPVALKNPKILIFGIGTKDRTKDSTKLVKSVYDQNEDIAGNDYKTFHSQFKPSHSWKQGEKPLNWVVEVDPIIRQKIMDNGSRIFKQWQAHRVVDYIDATRCYKCQKYGHVSKYCQQKDVCGHCAQVGHTFKNCSNKEAPSQCAACKVNKLPAAHRVVDRTCPSFLRAARVQLSRTNYNPQN